MGFGLECGRQSELCTVVSWINTTATRNSNALLRVKCSLVLGLQIFLRKLGVQFLRELVIFLWKSQIWHPTNTSAYLRNTSKQTSSSFNNCSDDESGKKQNFLWRRAGNLGTNCVPMQHCIEAGALSETRVLLMPQQTSSRPPRSRTVSIPATPRWVL